MRKLAWRDSALPRLSLLLPQELHTSAVHTGLFSFVVKLENLYPIIFGSMLLCSDSVSYSGAVQALRHERCQTAFVRTVTNRFQHYRWHQSYMHFSCAQRAKLLLRTRGKAWGRKESSLPASHTPPECKASTENYESIIENLNSLEGSVRSLEH